MDVDDITFRALEPEDLETLYKWENDTSLWQVSDTIMPLSRFNLREYILNSHIDIAISKQIRFVAELNGEPVGFADLYDYNVHNRRISVGVLVYEKSKRGMGIGTQMVKKICLYAFNTLCVHQVVADAAESNVASIALFKKCGFEQCGFKRDWLARGEGWENILEFQLLRK